MALRRHSRVEGRYRCGCVDMSVCCMSHKPLSCIILQQHTSHAEAGCCHMFLQDGTQENWLFIFCVGEKSRPTTFSTPPGKAVKRIALR